MLGELLQREPWIDSVETITTTAIPICTARATSPDIAGRVPVVLDISFVAADHNGARAVMAVREILRCYPLLKPLVMYTKGLLKQHQLGNAFTGGLSPYATVLLAAHFLGRSPPYENLGHAYLSFLHFLGHGLDPTRDVVKLSITLQCLEALPEVAHAAVPVAPAAGAMVTIVDPTNPANNVGRTAFRFNEVQAVAQQTLFFLTQPPRNGPLPLATARR